MRAVSQQRYFVTTYYPSWGVTVHFMLHDSLLQSRVIQHFLLHTHLADSQSTRGMLTVSFPPDLN